MRDQDKTSFDIFSLSIGLPVVITSCQIIGFTLEGIPAVATPLLGLPAVKIKRKTIRIR
jgi:hypothetical protein